MGGAILTYLLPVFILWRFGKHYPHVITNQAAYRLWSINKFHTLVASHGRPTLAWYSKDNSPVSVSHEDPTGWE